jgi:outer membrane protein insertion porin family
MRTAATSWTFAGGSGIEVKASVGRCQPAGKARALGGALLGLCAWLSASAPGQAQAPEETEPALLGRDVVSVSTTSDGPVDSEIVGKLIDVRAGRPLTEEATGATIRNLFATRSFADVQIEARPADGGVDVVVHLFRAFRVKPLKFSGVLPLPREELRRSLPFGEGSVFQRQEVEEGAGALQRRLQQEGFLRGRVTSEVTLDRVRFDVAVVYRLEPGPRARVARASFDGDTAPFTQEELWKHGRLKPGDRYSEAKARADATRMVTWLRKQSRLKASVDLIVAQPTDDGRIMPVYRVLVGKKIEFESRGVKASKVRRQINDLIQGQEFDEDLVLQYVENERDALQRKGYYRTRVDYAMSEGPDTATVTITVEQGPHFEIEKLEFAGNDSVPRKTLLLLMVTRQKGLPLLRPGHLVDREIDDDLAAIRGYYQTHGWVGVKVQKPRISEGSKPTRLVLTVPIEEGPRTVVASRKIVGADHIEPDVLEKELGVKAGEPFNPDQARQDAYNLLAYYQDHGWREASVKDEYALSPDRTSADVTYQVDEGLRSFFGKTIVRGNSRTDTRRVLQLVTWREGDPFSETKVVETQRNLARAAVFRRAEVRAQPADPSTRVRNVEIELQEGRPLSLLYGVGYQYAPEAVQERSDPFLVAGVSYNNLFGKMLSAGLDGQLALSGRFRLQLSFRDPFLFNRDYPFTSYLFAAREPIQDIDIERLGWVNEVSHYFGQYLRVAVRIEYQRIRAFNPQDLSLIEQENFPRFDQPIEEATTGPNFFYDRRDNVLDPHRGYYATGAIKYAFPIFKAEARYTKLSAQYGYFIPIGRNVLAVSGRAGAIFPYGPSDIQVPINERLFGGKNSTNRGFDTDLLGIPGETVDYDTRATPHTTSGPGNCPPTFPGSGKFDCNAGPRIIGGNGMLDFNAEFRFPIAGPVHGALFYDVGQIWQNFSDVNLRFEGSHGLRQSVGIGLRVLLPIGPLRADLGVPVQRRTIPVSVTTVDSNGDRLVLGSAGSVKEKAHLFVSIGYPF